MFKPIYASSKYAVMADRDGWVEVIRVDGAIRELSARKSDDAVFTVSSFAKAAQGALSAGAITAIDLYLDAYFK